MDIFCRRKAAVRESLSTGAWSNRRAKVWLDDPTPSWHYSDEVLVVSRCWTWIVRRRSITSRYDKVVFIEAGRIFSMDGRCWTSFFSLSFFALSVRWTEKAGLVSGAGQSRQRLGNVTFSVLGIQLSGSSLSFAVGWLKIRLLAGQDESAEWMTNWSISLGRLYIRWKTWKSHDGKMPSFFRWAIGTSAGRHENEERPKSGLDQAIAGPDKRARVWLLWTNEFGPFQCIDFSFLLCPARLTVLERKFHFGTTPRG